MRVRDSSPDGGHSVPPECSRRCAPRTSARHPAFSLRRGRSLRLTAGRYGAIVSVRSRSAPLPTCERRFLPPGSPPDAKAMQWRATTSPRSACAMPSRSVVPPSSRSAGCGGLGRSIRHAAAGPSSATSQVPCRFGWRFRSLQTWPGIVPRRPGTPRPPGDIDPMRRFRDPVARRSGPRPCGQNRANACR